MVGALVGVVVGAFVLDVGVFVVVLLVVLGFTELLVIVVVLDEVVLVFLVGTTGVQALVGLPSSSTPRLSVVLTVSAATSRFFVLSSDLDSEETLASADSDQAEAGALGRWPL